MEQHIIADSELIITPQGHIYHLDLHPEELATTIITVGDPNRVAEVSKYFSKIEVKRAHREFVTHTGEYNGKRISVVATGIGPDNIDIVFNELDALVNIDLNTRKIKEQFTALDVVRMGTSGSLQGDIPCDSLVVGTHGIGLDNLLHYYQLETPEELEALKAAFVAQVGLENSRIVPYIAKGSEALLKKFDTNDGYHHGITVTCPGFYAPQGRQLRLPVAYPNLVNNLSIFKHESHRITNFEMETSAIYGLGQLLGHNCLAVNTIVANRVNKTFSKDSAKGVDTMIEKSLHYLTK